MTGPAKFGLILFLVIVVGGLTVSCARGRI